MFRSGEWFLGLFLYDEVCASLVIRPVSRIYPRFVYSAFGLPCDVYQLSFTALIIHDTSGN